MMIFLVAFTKYLIPLIIQLLVVLGFVFTTVAASQYLGPKRKTAGKLESFESGLDAVGNARVPFSVKYFLAAILFVLFDVEIIFLYPWAVNFKELGWQGFVEMLMFIVFFTLGFFYVLKKGALKWDD
ncbi:MAG: NADH-quinone oxidoreductase subunit A [Chitinophagales bacterium]|nr:NADH-quinone oxidoreductase subunit A [Chitinophagales bacterium]